MTSRPPKHRGRANPFGPRALTRPGALVAAAVAVLAVGAAPLLVGAADGTAASGLVDPIGLSADRTAPDPIALAQEASIASSTSLKASSAQNPEQFASASAPTAPPVHLSIASIGVDVDLTTLDRRPDGSLEPPTGLLEAGWYQDSAIPGAVGPAVIAGHVDDTEDAGIFARLHELGPGSEIVVTLADGSREVFTTDFSIDVAKVEFPTEAVYGATRTPQLRLITCNGPYDFDAMHYSNNLVLFASHQGA